MRRLAYQALAIMKTRKYKIIMKKNEDDSQRDTCAVCLDLYKSKQVWFNNCLLTKLTLKKCLQLKFHV